jgi:hypothetical protein
MTSSISNILYTKTAEIAHSIPLPSSRQILKNIEKIAIPAIALVAASNMVTAKAGPLLEVTCYAACAGLAMTPWGLMTFPAWMDKCLAVCMISGFAPTP